MATTLPPWGHSARPGAIAGKNVALTGEPSLRIAVVGTGYAGLVTAVCLARLGHVVTAYDADTGKRANLRAGKVPIFEPGLAEILTTETAAGRLSFPDNLASSVNGAAAIFLAVGTPTGSDEHADLSAVYEATRSIANAVTAPATLICKSTVPLGTVRSMQQLILRAAPGAQLTVASNPEFLREGRAIRDFLQPDRLVFGTLHEKDLHMLRAIYAPLLESGVPAVETAPETAEVIKYAANAFLATRLALINELADLCERTGADIMDVAHGVGLDRRIGPEFLRPGPGYGGSCFPKDMVALATTAAEMNVHLRILDAVMASNEARKHAIADRIIRLAGEATDGLRIAVLGVAFKANTDDMREAPSLAIVPALQAAGALITAYDPQAMMEAASLLPGVIWSMSAEDAARDADALVLLTDWEVFGTLDWDEMNRVMRGKLIIDLRNALDPAAMHAAGFTYHGIGRHIRPAQKPEAEATPHALA